MDVGGSSEQMMRDHERNMSALLRIPGVLGVAFGLKEAAGERSCRRSATGCTSRKKDLVTVGNPPQTFLSWEFTVKPERRRRGAWMRSRDDVS